MVAGKDKTNPISGPERTTAVNGAWFGDAQVTARWADDIRMAVNGAAALRGRRQDRCKENEG